MMSLNRSFAVVTGAAQGIGQNIAHGVSYLASSEAGFVTGTELVIDGGWTAR